MDRRGGDEMPAYFIVQSTISDEAQYQKYREAVVPMMMKHGANAASVLKIQNRG